MTGAMLDTIASICGSNHHSARVLEDYNGITAVFCLDDDYAGATIVGVSHGAIVSAIRVAIRPDDDVVVVDFECDGIARHGAPDGLIRRWYDVDGFDTKYRQYDWVDIARKTCNGL